MKQKAIKLDGFAMKRLIVQSVDAIGQALQGKTANFDEIAKGLMRVKLTDVLEKEEFFAYDRTEEMFMSLNDMCRVLYGKNKPTKKQRERVTKMMVWLQYNFFKMDFKNHDRGSFPLFAKYGAYKKEGYDDEIVRFTINKVFKKMLVMYRRNYSIPKLDILSLKEMDRLGDLFCAIEGVMWSRNKENFDKLSNEIERYFN